MPSTLSAIISKLRGVKLASTLPPCSYVNPYLQNCSGSFREIRVVIDNEDVSPYLGEAGLIKEPIRDAEKEIVLAIGINYGQGNYCSWPPVTPLDWMDDTEMRPKIDSLSKCYSRRGAIGKFPTPGNYHLIATNIFPFITNLSWSGQELNGIEEAKLLQDYWHWATDLLDTLLPALSPEFLIFHGANNAVPLFGVSYISKKYLSKSPRAEVILCDNLARPGTTIHNCEIIS